MSEPENIVLTLLRAMRAEIATKAVLVETFIVIPANASRKRGSRGCRTSLANTLKRTSCSPWIPAFAHVR